MPMPMPIAMPMPMSMCAQGPTSARQAARDRLGEATRRAEAAAAEQADAREWYRRAAASELARVRSATNLMVNIDI